MGIFGWSYPPGAASDPSAPYNQDFDDTICAICGNALPEDPQPDTWAEQGYCGLGCALKDPGPMRWLVGSPAIELASAPGNLGGPGFEWSKIVLTQAEAGKAEGVMLSKTRASEDAKEHGYAVPPESFGNSWAWRLWADTDAGPKCMEFRLTRRTP